MSDVKHLPNCYTLNPELWDAPCNCAELRAEDFKAAYMAWQDKTEWVQKTAQPSELGKHRADVMAERIAKAEAERDQLRAELAEYQEDPSYATACETIRKLRAELAAIRGQQAGWKLVPIEPTAEMIAAGFNAYPCNLARTYRVYVDAAPLPPQQPDAVSVPSDTALRRAAKFLAGIDNGCNEVKTLRALVANAQVVEAVSVPREWIDAVRFAEAMLTNLQPHIVQACYPGRARFLDNYVDPVLDKFRALLSTRQAEEGE